MSNEAPRRRGRPRKYANETARKQAYRDRWILTKVTVDVPDALTDNLRCYAERLRHISISFDSEQNDIARILQWTAIRGQDGLQVRLRNGTLRGEVRALKRNENNRRAEVFEWAVISRHQRLESDKDGMLKISSYEIIYAKGICVGAITARTLCEMSILLCFSEHVDFDYAKLREEAARARNPM